MYPGDSLLSTGQVLSILVQRVQATIRKTLDVNQRELPCQLLGFRCLLAVVPKLLARLFLGQMPEVDGANDGIIVNGSKHLQHSAGQVLLAAHHVSRKPCGRPGKLGNLEPQVVGFDRRH